MSKLSLDEFNAYMNKNHKDAITNPFKCKGYTFGDFDVAISTENLMGTVKGLDDLGINYRLVFGTLLGIYRDGALIPHDTDVDLALPWYELPKLTGYVEHMLTLGYEVVRYSPNVLLSLGKNGNFVDFYFF